MWISAARHCVTGLIALLLSGCAHTAGPFRTTPPGDPVCAHVHDLQARNQEFGDETLRRCAMQKHLLPGASAAQQALQQAGFTPEAEQGAQSVNEWTKMAAAQGRVLLQPDGYTLGFVELADDGALEKSWQLPAVVQHLQEQDRAGRQNYVVAYVHGWRHNAELRDGDIRKLRRLLAYSRAALNSRCVAVGAYCNTALTGVFIGWNGQKVREGPSDDNPDQPMSGGLSGLGPALTFWDRWNVSCELAAGKSDCMGKPPQGFQSPLRKVLRNIEGELSLKPGDARRDKFLIFGHSMGGNMLAAMLRDDVTRDVATHRPGTEMHPPIGDLVVLLNPAARSQDWTAIQRAERKRAGLGDSNRLTCLREDASRDPNCKDRAGLIRWHQLYPVSQRPVYVSLTSAADWGTLKQKDRPVQHDDATGRIFPFAREFIGESGPEKVVAIGHRTPNYKSRFAVHGDPVGTSHEVAVLQGAQTDDGRRFRSRYGNAVKPEAGWCEPADGWLRRARLPGHLQPGQYATNWDYGLVRRDAGQPPVSSRNIGGGHNKAAVQWRQGMYLKTHTGALSVSPGTSPFWNARALDSAIRGHAGWANYATWCALNQLVLDDVTAAVPESLPPGEAQALAGQETRVRE